MFDDKEKIKFFAEGIRNIGVALIVGGMLAYATTDKSLESVVTVLSGFIAFVASVKLLENFK